LDDVVWRLVNKLLAELLKNNSIAMMVLLSSAAANNTASVVSSAGSLAYQGAATGGKLLTSVGSVFVGKTATPVAATPASTAVPAPASPARTPQQS
jgi:pyruvate/2-oxoacid:ferredoxin oxidoreductase alpha subunit